MGSPLKILQCIRQGQIGGGESHLLSLVQNLDREQFESHVLSFTDGPMVDRLKEMGIPVYIIPTTKPFDFSKWGEVKKLMQKLGTELVHAHGTRANSNVNWAARSLKIPVIYTVHGWSFHQDQNPVVRTIRVMGESYLTRNSNLNISVSSSNQQSGKKHLKHFNSVVINNGIDLNRFNPSSSHKDIREELHIGKDKVLVLFIARFTSHKQPLSLIQAFKEAVKVLPSLHLLMVGEGDQREEAQTIVAEAKLEDKITLLPFRQDVPDVLSSADIFVLPSLWEGLPIGLLEAMAMGKAVIATNVDGTCEIIRNDENGRLIETAELIPALTKALVELGRNSDLRARFQERAVQTVTSQYNAAHMTRQIESYYTQLAPKKQEKPVSVLV